MALLSAPCWISCYILDPSGKSWGGHDAMASTSICRSPGIPWFTKSPGSLPSLLADFFEVLTDVRDVLARQIPWRKKGTRFGGNTNMELFEHQLWETPQNTMVYPHFPKSLSKNGHLGVSIPFLGQTMFAWKCHGFKREWRKGKWRWTKKSWANKHGQSSSCGKDSIHLNTT